jgi:predicted dienelactone hydrolase
LIDVLAQYPLENLLINVPTLLRLAHRLTDQFELESDLFSRLAALGPPSKGSTRTLEGSSQAGQQPYQRHGFTFAGRDGNTIQSVVLIPRSSRTSASVSKPRPAPLIVLAPGLNTDFNALLYVGDHLASHGYAVAALDFPFTSANRVSAAIQGLATIPPPNAWYSQPLNVSRLIDALAARWPGQIDSRRVGVLGQSLGGYTVLALGGAQLDWKNLERACAVVNDPNHVEFNPAVLWQCKAPSAVVKRADFSDPRIKAVVAVNPVSNKPYAHPC